MCFDCALPDCHQWPRTQRKKTLMFLVLIYQTASLYFSAWCSGHMLTGPCCPDWLCYPLSKYSSVTINTIHESRKHTVCIGSPFFCELQFEALSQWKGQKGLTQHLKEKIDSRSLTWSLRSDILYTFTIFIIILKVELNSIPSFIPAVINACLRSSCANEGVANFLIS